MTKRWPYYVILILAGMVVVLSVKYGLQRQELAQVQALVNRQTSNDRLINFTDLFVNQVLLAAGEVDFETRLKLENAVRGLKDEALLAEWKTFVASTNEAAAQTQVKRLLGMLLERIKGNARD